MYGELNACMRKLLGACMRILGASLWSGWVHVCGCWVQSMRLLGAKYAVVGCIYMETFGCMYADFGCMSMERLGACMRLLGAKYAEFLGCKYAVVGCKSMERLGACLTVGSFA